MYSYVICKAFDLIYFFLVRVVLCLCGYTVVLKLRFFCII
jgi:hypothetical protein